MNTFEKWWNNTGYFIHKEHKNDIIEISRAAWDAHKKKVIKIINNQRKKLTDNYGVNDGIMETCDVLEQKIKKL